MSNLKHRLARVEQDMKPDKAMFVVEADVDHIEAGLVDTRALVREKYGVEPTEQDLVVLLARLSASWERKEHGEMSP